MTTKSSLNPESPLFDKLKYDRLLAEIPQRDVLSVEHVTVMLNYKHTQTVYKKVRKNEIPSRKQAGGLFFFKVELLDFINQGVH